MTGLNAFLVMAAQVESLLPSKEFPIHTLVCQVLNVGNDSNKTHLRNENIAGLCKVTPVILRGVVSPEQTGLNAFLVLAAQVESLLPSERSFTESSCATTLPANLPRARKSVCEKKNVRECVCA